MALLSSTGFAMAADMGADAKPAAASTLGAMPLGGKGAMPADHPAAIPADTNLINSAKVLEVIDSPTYIYLKVNSEKGPVWLAAYRTKVTKGATVKFSDGMAMQKFYSKTLNRTFDTIIFVDSLKVEK